MERDLLPHSASSTVLWATCGYSHAYVDVNCAEALARLRLGETDGCYWRLAENNRWHLIVIDPSWTRAKKGFSDNELARSRPQYQVKRRPPRVRCLFFWSRPGREHDEIRVERGSARRCDGLIAFVAASITLKRSWKRNAINRPDSQP